MKDTSKVNLFQPEEKLPGSIHLLESAEFIASEVDRIYYKKEDQIFEKYIKDLDNQLKNDIKRAKEQADFVIMMAHCGGQRNDLPEEYSKYVINKCVEYGCDYVVGNHPHIIQMSEYINNVFVSYCLGNFMFVWHDYDNSDIDMNYSIIQNVYLTKDNDKVSYKTGFEVIFMNPIDSLPYPINAYDFYNQTKNEEIKNKILFFANRFANKENYYKEIKKEFFIE